MSQSHETPGKKKLGFWGSWASILALPLTLIGVLLAVLSFLGFDNTWALLRELFLWTGGAWSSFREGAQKILFSQIPIWLLLLLGGVVSILVLGGVIWMSRKHLGKPQKASTVPLVTRTAERSYEYRGALFVIQNRVTRPPDFYRGMLFQSSVPERYRPKPYLTIEGPFCLSCQTKLVAENRRWRCVTCGWETITREDFYDALNKVEMAAQRDYPRHQWGPP